MSRRILQNTAAFYKARYDVVSQKSSLYLELKHADML
jgi:hypothetical protein